MPTPPKKHRTYCKDCNNFTIHSWNIEKELECETCNTVYTPYNPSEVSRELIQQQRERYRQSEVKKVSGLYEAFMRGAGIDAIMNMETFQKAEVVECDAGQKEIDKRKKQQKEEQRRAVQEILDDYNANYKELNRNDKCSCGSGKKFKQCHLQYFNKYLNI